MTNFQTGAPRRSAPMFSWLLLALTILSMAAPARAQDVGEEPGETAATAPATAPATGTGSLAGQVLTTGGDAVPDARIELMDWHRRVRGGVDGTFRFEGLRPGRYVVEAESPSLGKGSARVEVAAGREVAATILIDVAVLQDEVVVSSGFGPRRQLEVAQPTNVLAGEDLDQHREATLGETLAREPGVSSTCFGPGASRPIIRGLGGDRVRMLTDGLGSADASNLSPDHAVAIEPQAAERIEVLRGPATLLYGSTAVGGVVNVLDDRIPGHRTDARISGTLDLAYGTGADERSSALALDGGLGSFAWHGDYSRRESGDVAIPGLASLDPEARATERRGVLANSALDNESASLGASWIGEAGMVGVAASGFDSLYGVPGGGNGEEGPVRIELEQRRVDVKSELYQSFGPFRGARLRLGLADYQHTELAGEAIGTRFLANSWESRLELIQRERGGLGTGTWTGSSGLQLARSDFSARGEEAFVPPSETRSGALFTFQELALGEGHFHLQLGGRYERQEIAARVADRSLPPSRSFDGLSASLGLVWEPNDDYSAALSAARSERLPTATELYADGPHAATASFEIGNPDLAAEASLGLDLSLRKRTGRLTGTLNFFYNRFDDYIFERFTGELTDGLATVLFDQQDARFQGAELQGLLNLLQAGSSHLDLTFGADLVRAELRSTGEPLPRIPPVSLSLGLSYHRERFRAYGELYRAEQQDRVGTAETPTDGYTLLSAGVSYRIFVGGRVLDFLLRGRNLTDEEARNHASFLKNDVPLPGRDFSLGLRLTF